MGNIRINCSKIITLTLSAVLLLQNGALFAQSFNPQQISSNIFSASKGNFSINLPYVPPARESWRTITYWAQHNKVDAPNGAQLLQIIADKKYMASNDIYTEESCKEGYNGLLKCELSVLNATLPFAQFNNHDTKHLTEFVNNQLRHPYNAKGKDFSLYYRYSIIAASLVANPSAGRQMLDLLIANLKDTSAAPATQVWTAHALAEVVYLSPYQHRYLRAELNKIIADLSLRLKDKPVENHPIGLKVDNQYTAVKAFAYTISFFAKKKDDGFVKSMVTTGTFTERSAYLQNPMPGQDSDGDFMSTPDGNRHNIAFHLIIALFNEYDLSQEPQLINSFIIRYAKADTAKKEFKNYFLFAIYGMEIAQAYNENKSLDGWDEQYKNFLYALTKTVWKIYPFCAACVTVQGGAEVCTEWMAFAEVLKGLGFVGKSSVKGVIRLLPVKQALRMSVLISARKIIFRNIGKALTGGFSSGAVKSAKKFFACGAGAAVLQSDTRFSRGSGGLKLEVVGKDEIYKKILE